MASYKGSHERLKAKRAGEKVQEALRPYCSLTMICGSIRRMRPVVGDVDIEAMARDLPGALKAIRDMGGETGKNNGWVMVDGVSVDIGFVDRKSWGAALCHMTGPAEENIRLRRQAMKKGYKLSQNGLVDRGTNEMVAGATEQDVYEALGLEYVPPEQRDVSCGRITQEENDRILEVALNRTTEAVTQE